MTIKFLRKAAGMLIFSAGTNKDTKRGVRAMRDLLIAGIRIRRKYAKRGTKMKLDPLAGLATPSLPVTKKTKKTPAKNGKALPGQKTDMSPIRQNRS